MKMISYFAPYTNRLGATLLSLLLLLAACEDMDLLQNGHPAQGIDPNRLMEVSLPILTSSGIQTEMETRAGGTDSQIKDILLFVFERKYKANQPGVLDTVNCKRIAFRHFTKPGMDAGQGGGWIETEGSGQTKGQIKFYAPVGDVYIYLIANSSGSLIQFFPNVTDPGGSGGKDELSNLKQFWNDGVPKWTGNLFSTDGYLPMIGMVDNTTGACTIQPTDPANPDCATAVVAFEKMGADQQITTSVVDAQNPFQLKRLMCKVSVEIVSGANGRFIPKEYGFRHVSQFVSPTIYSWTDKEKQDLPTQDTPYFTFSSQTPNSFTVYLPENVKNDITGLTEFAQRDLVRKTAEGSNMTETEDTEFEWPFGEEEKAFHQGHYRFQHAPRNATYLEITGRYEGKMGGTGPNPDAPVSADTKYYVHLGDFSNGQWGKFSLDRDHHYKYKMTINGVSSIHAEVMSAENTEIQPGAEGIVFKGGVHLQVDAHYEQVEVKMEKNWFSNGLFIYADTPYGLVSGTYYPKAWEDPNKQGKFFPEGPSHAQTADQVRQLTDWVSFRKQNGADALQAYNPTQVQDVITMLDEFYGSSDKEAYYTCFINEYYYTTLPFNGKHEKPELSHFINTVDRAFGFSSDLTYSQDRQSAVANNKLLIQQRAIACFYDLADSKVAKYGIESIDEVTDPNADGEKEQPIAYGTPAATSPLTGIQDGLNNTWTEVAGQTTPKRIKVDNYIQTAQNGWLWNNGTPRRGNGLKNQHGYLSCLTRNRDLNGDGYLDEDELRWYTPSRDQLIGVWIGEDAMPREAALYTFDTSRLPANGQNRCQQAIFSSSHGGNRAIWAEQGCSFGEANNVNNTHQGMVFAVRNLGTTLQAQAHLEAPGNFYHWDPNLRTIEVYLTENALRPFTNQELRPHHERSEINRPYRKFKVAKEMLYKNEIRTFTCNNHWKPETIDKREKWLQISAPQDAMGTNGATLASEYEEDEIRSWRLPNQRELALMVLAGAMPEKQHGIWTTYPSDMECKGILEHSWRSIYTKVFYTRTHFSNSHINGDANAYTEYGYIYNAADAQIQMMDYNKYKEAGYWCVKDIKE